jgi:hypothetical protein
MRLLAEGVDAPESCSQAAAIARPSELEKLHPTLHPRRALAQEQVDLNGKARPAAASSQSPLTDSNRRAPPCHEGGRSQARCGLARHRTGTRSELWRLFVRLTHSFERWGSAELPIRDPLVVDLTDRFSACSTTASTVGRSIRGRHRKATRAAKPRSGAVAWGRSRHVRIVPGRFVIVRSR